MKNLILFGLLLLVVQLYAQDDKSKRPSPPAQTKATVGKKTIVIDYSQPSVKGRNVWSGDLAPYGQVWRTGANESTTIEFSDDVMVEGKAVPKGRYALFTIPGEKKWTIIINKGIHWGAYDYKQEEDVVRVEVPAKKSKDFTEKFTINANNKGVVTLLWENVQVDFQVK